MTTKDLMQRLGLGYRSATELMRSSGFPSIQVGKKFVVDEQAYEKWYRLNQGRQVIRQPVSTPMIKCKKGGADIFLDFLGNQTQTSSIFQRTHRPERHLDPFLVIPM